nr:ribonuclease H-like domain-containing protein [Tanacetum cinerariifolium]
MDGFVIFKVVQKINGLKQGYLSVHEHYHTLNSLWREFDILSLLSTCTCAAHEGLLKHNQLVRLMQFLMRLNDLYQPSRSNLLARDPLPDVKDAFAVVSREESHRGLAPRKITAKTNHAAFVAKTNNGNNNFNNNIRVNSNNNSNRGPNPNLVCKHCGLIGHTIKRCYELNGYPVSFKRNPNLSKQYGLMKKFNGNNVNASQSGSTSSGSMTASFTNDQMMKPLTLINEKPAANVSSSMAELWHCRLGHPADQVLSVLSDQIGFKTRHHVSAFDICHKAKQTRELFPLNDHKSVKFGELIHLDVWGFFDTISSQTPHDEKGDTSKEDGNAGAFSYEETIPIATQIEEHVTFEGKSQNFSIGEGFGLRDEPQTEVRRSSRLKSQLVRFNDYVNWLGDVRFYETVFPFKMQDLSKEKCVTNDTSTEVDWLGVFDTISSQSDGSGLWDEQQTKVRRSSRPKSQPVRFNDYVVSSNVKYGLEKFVWYSKLSSVNNCFSTVLNKSVELKSYIEACNDENWINAMNLEMKALHKNETSVLADVPVERKTIGSKWVYRIKYKTSGEIDRYKTRLVAQNGSANNVADVFTKGVLSMLSFVKDLTPVDIESKLGDGGTPIVDPTLYWSLAGSLQYLTFTRPDITYAVQHVCLYMHDLREPHFSALKRILRYVQGTLDYGLQLFSSTTNSLIAYLDADWVGCPTTRRSTSGVEAEYRGVANAIAETCWTRNLLRELHTPLSSATIVYCDNVSVVYLSSNPVQHQRTKHIEIDIHFVQDLVATGQVRVLYVPSRRKRDEVEAEYEGVDVDKGEDEGVKVKIGEKRKGVGKGDEELLVAKEGFDDEEKLLRTVFVGNLPLKVKKKALFREFAKFGIRLPGRVL